MDPLTAIRFEVERARAEENDAWAEEGARVWFRNLVEFSAWFGAFLVLVWLVFRA